MQNQPKFVPAAQHPISPMGASVRPQVENTVARGQLYESDYFYTGLVDGKEADVMPFPVTMEVLARGQERFNIYCTPCHSRVGNGAGMIVQRGYRPAGNFHDAKLMAEPLGHYFYVMTNGYGAMPDYKAQVAPADRWAIVAYIQALQLSQTAKTADAPAGAQVENLPTLQCGRVRQRVMRGRGLCRRRRYTERRRSGTAAGAPAENPAKQPGSKNVVTGSCAGRRNEPASGKAFRSAADNEATTLLHEQHGLTSDAGSAACCRIGGGAERCVWRIGAGHCRSVLALLGAEVRSPALGREHILRGWLKVLSGASAVHGGRWRC